MHASSDTAYTSSQPGFAAAALILAVLCCQLIRLQHIPGKKHALAKVATTPDAWFISQEGARRIQASALPAPCSSSFCIYHSHRSQQLWCTK